MGWHKPVIILGILSFLLITACGEETNFICNKPYIQVGDECCLDVDNNNICDEHEEETVETKITEPVQETTVQKDTTVDDLIEIANARIKSLSYFSSHTDIGQVFIAIKDNKMIIEPTKPLLINQEIVDTIFLDDIARTAIGQCLSLISCGRSVNIELDYHQYREETPLEILNRFKGMTPEQVIEKVGMVNRRATDLYVFRIGRNKRTKLFIDREYKVPLRVEELQGPSPSIYLFKDLSINTVSNKTVIPSQ